MVCFHGCPLRCRYCLNPFSFAENTAYTQMTPLELYQQVQVDELYFLATEGGVTFGGGEPLLRAEFIKEFRRICGKEWLPGTFYDNDDSLTCSQKGNAAFLKESLAKNF